MVLLWFSYNFLWFSLGFPIVSPWFSCGFHLVSLWFYLAFLCVYGTPSLASFLTKVGVHVIHMRTHFGSRLDASKQWYQARSEQRTAEQEKDFCICICIMYTPTASHGSGAAGGAAGGVGGVFPMSMEQLQQVIGTAVTAALGAKCTGRGGASERRGDLGERAFRRMEAFGGAESDWKEWYFNF